jgi:hypothetical protein
MAKNKVYTMSFIAGAAKKSQIKRKREQAKEEKKK